MIRYVMKNHKLLDMVKEVEQTSLAPLDWNEVFLLLLSHIVGRDLLLGYFRICLVANFLYLLVGISTSGQGLGHRARGGGGGRSSSGRWSVWTEGREGRTIIYTQRKTIVLGYTHICIVLNEIDKSFVSCQGGGVGWACGLWLSCLPRGCSPRWSTMT